MPTPAGRLLTIAIALATLAIAVLAGGAGAGQVFVAVGVLPNQNRFLPTPAGMNAQGDFVIWTWVTNSHTVTSGPLGSPNGIFDSDPGGTTTHGAGSVFAWRTDRTGNIPYFSRPTADLASQMKGTIVVPDALPPAMADFRITEVRFDNVGSDFIEIANLGTGDGNLRGFRLSINGSDPPTSPWTVSTSVAPDGRVVVDNPGLSNSGSVALYAPYLAGSLPYTALATNDSLMVDYVEWGPNGGQPLEDTAIKVAFPAEIWFAGEFAPAAKPGHSIVRCEAPDVYGSAAWNESTVPTRLDPNNCQNPVRATTWGRLKTLYR
jgi:plastocyanin